MNVLLAGVDEAGRGPLAGPVVAAAVILDPRRPICGLRDSKQLSALARGRLAVEIRGNSLAWAVAEASVSASSAVPVFCMARTTSSMSGKSAIAPMASAKGSIFCTNSEYSISFSAPVRFAS